MNFLTFDEIVTALKKQQPILFSLESDNVPSDLQIAQIENYYQIQFSDDYKKFIKKYGGGFFGYAMVLSCDINSDNCLLQNISKEWVNEHEFLPIIDFETGDYLGVKIKNNQCGDTMSIYLHEENQIISKKYNLWEALLEYGLKYN